MDTMIRSSMIHSFALLMVTIDITPMTAASTMAIDKDTMLAVAPMIFIIEQ